MLTIESTSIDFVTGFRRKPSTWRFSASSRTSSRPNAVTMTTAGCLWSEASVLMIRVAWSPSMPGILQSMKTMS